jgi:heme peroxidase
MSTSHWLRRGRRLASSAAVMAASLRASAHRLSLTQAPPPVAGAGYRRTTLWRIYNSVSQLVDRSVGWDRLPTPLGLVVLIGVRNVLRQKNLYDTNQVPASGAATPEPFASAVLTGRDESGAYNDLDHPAMGMKGTRFGRNIPLDKAVLEPDSSILEPSPRVVSRELLTRDPFQPATSVNILACTWLQFMIKDWFSHGAGDISNPWTIELSPDDPWPEHPMRIPRTIADPTRPAGSPGPPTFLNTETHWWDGSQIYGTTAAQQGFVRAGEDGKLRIGANGRPPLPDDPSLNPAMVPGWWLGLSLMRTMFTLEHNAICDRLRSEYPSWSDEALFQRARLVNAALLAKIHTVDWTPAVISHPTTVIGLRANWFGLAGERLHKAFGRLSGSEVVSGIPGSETNHYGVPYTLTEEFTAVYRMHPLVPDDYDFRRVADDTPLRQMTFGQLTGPQAEQILDELPVDDIVYSLGTSHPGLVALHNYPRFLQDFVRPDGKHQDIAATDVLRIREIGVPRYNEFRRLLHLKPAPGFSALTDNPQWARQLERVYGGDIELVDLMVGMYAERRPKGFAFSDTAFRIFILMASRRLNSDRFLTRDFTREVYTPAGMQWLDDNNMMTVLLRHFPALAPAMRGVDNAFWPWHTVGPTS